MAAKVPITLDAPADALAGYGAGALLRVQWSATETGVYANLTTIAIVSTQFLYEYWDNNGDTTTWYRWRIENAAGTETGEYSQPFQGVDPAIDSRASGSYADLDDLELTFRTKVTDPRYLGRAQRALVNTTRDLIREIGYSFFQTSTETRLYHAKGGTRLHVHEGIVSLTTLEIQTSPGSAWVPLATTDYYLEGQPGEDYRRPGEPYFHIVLEELGTYRTWPTVRRGVRATGRFGWPAILGDHRDANVAWARQDLAGDPTFPGSILGPDDIGGPVVGADRWPRAVYDLVMAERQRFWCAT